MIVKDYFSTQSDDYARYRPHYPAALFRWLAARTPARGLAWDCGCGSGQATRELARNFNWVVATDPSGAQLAKAPPLPNVEYRCVPAEEAKLATQGFDLVLVAQALHWFDLDRFYVEVRRVLRPDGLLAVVTYDLLLVTPEVDAVISRFYHEALGRWWPPERHHIENGYRTLAFPFTELVVPAFRMEADWSMEHLVGYLRTWSALQIYLREQQDDPLLQLVPQLRKVWGDHDRRRVVWPLTLRVGSVSAETT